MLSSLLSQLQSYFSKYFIVGSFSPVLAFAFINGLTAYQLSDRWGAWVDRYVAEPTAARAAFVITAVTVAITLAAYVLSSLNTFLRRMLEGRWWEPLARLLKPAQLRHRREMVAAMEAAAADKIDLDEAPQLVKRLLDARQAGSEAHKGNEFRKPNQDSLENAIRALEEKRRENEIVPAAGLSQVVGDLEARLNAYDVDVGTYLDRQHQRVGHLITYAVERAKARYARLLNQLHASYGSEHVAPTRMGNIANTIQDYALRRYRCNLEIVWSNLQRVVQKDEKAQAALQEAKTQLDFLVACCWLTLLWSLIWGVAFALIAQSRIGFLSAALGGPLLAYIFYRAAVEQYRSFADVSMTTLDSFRFDLLEEMRLPLPPDVEGERYVWESVNLLATYDEERNFRYEQPKPA